jgi:hypothetical protein
LQPSRETWADSKFDLPPLNIHDEGRMVPNRNIPPKNKSMEGKYANYFKVGYNSLEFLIDFGQSYINDADQETIHTRIVTSPPYAKNFLQTLARAVDHYITQYGSIEDD